MTDLIDIIQARELRDTGTAMADAAERPDWKHRADEAISTLAATGREFTAEDVRQLAGDPLHPNAMGARFLTAARSGVIECVGFTTGTRVPSHARILRRYRGA